MSITLNLTIDQETFDSTGSYELRPEGKYKVSIFEAEVKNIENKASAYNGKPRINFVFKVLPGEEYQNSRFFFGANAFAITSKKDGKVHPPYDLIALGKAIGLTKEQLENIDLDEWKGEELEIEVKHVAKMSKESGYKEPELDSAGDPVLREEVTSKFRSLKAAATASAAAKGKTNTKANKFTL